MRESRYYLAMDEYDRGIIMRALAELRNKQIREHRPIEPVNDVMLKVDGAKRKHFRVIEREPADR